MGRTILAMRDAEKHTIFVKEGNRFVVHMKGTLEEVCSESRTLNAYGRTHRITQEAKNLCVLSTLDTNKTKESIGQ